MRKTHDLQILPGPFREMELGVKKFDVRNDSLGFAVGDLLHFIEFHPHLGELGGEFTARVIHICRGINELSHFKESVVVLGIEVVEAERSDSQPSDPSRWLPDEQVLLNSISFEIDYATKTFRFSPAEIDTPLRSDALSHGTHYIGEISWRTIQEVVRKKSAEMQLSPKGLAALGYKVCVHNGEVAFEEPK